MSIFKGLLRIRDRPKNTSLSSAFRFLFGPSAAGKNVNEYSAMQITAVYSCVRLLSEAVASLPLHVLRRQEDGSKEKAEDHPLFFLLHDEPNPEMTSFSFRETMMLHLLLTGNFYAQIIRNGRGQVTALYPLMPNQMSVDRGRDGKLIYTYTKNFDEALPDKQMTVKLAPEEVLHVPGLSYSGLIGYSPIAVAKDAIGLSIAAGEYASTFFSNNAQPSGILSHPGVLKDSSKLRESWNQTFGGSGNANKVAVLEEGVTFTPISITPEQSQFLQTRKFQVEEIARIFRVPPHMLGDLDRATFNNVENLSQEFVTYTLNPWVIRIEAAMARRLLLPEEKSRYMIRMNVDGLLRASYKERMEGYATAINNGIMCPNNARALEDLDLIPEELGGWQYMVNGNMVKLKDVGAAYEKGGTKTDVETD